MKIQSKIMLLYLTGLVTFTTSVFVTASDHKWKGHNNSPHDTICKKSADKMFESCRFEIKEEFFATKAKCINLGDNEEREVCLDLAKETRREDRISCREQKKARKEVCDLLDEDRYDPEAFLNTNNFVEDPDDSNPYFSLQPGHTYVARAGEDFEETIIVTVTDEVRAFLGVNCRLVVDIVLVKDNGEYDAVEVTDDYYAQAKNNDIHYCGEVSRNFEDGLLVNLDGSFQAGTELAKSGILIKAAPVAGDAHRQEYLLGEAEDTIRYLAGEGSLTSVGPGEGGENPAFPCDGKCVKTEEFIPPEPGDGEFKYFKKDYGFVLGVALEDGEPTGERDEVMCRGESLDILKNCGGQDFSGLREQLCKLSPEAFCED